MCGIYLIQNIIDGKIYIGQAVDIGLRWSSHLSLLQAGKHPSKYLQEAVDKFGIDNFTFTILCECEENQLDTLEQYYIFCLESTDQRVGYNRQYGGTSNTTSRYAPYWEDPDDIINRPEAVKITPRQTDEQKKKSFFDGF